MEKNRTYHHVIISDKAKRLLGAHIRFLAQVNHNAAVAKREQNVSALRSLSQMPERFPFFEADYIPPNRYHRMFVEKWYLVLYQIRDDTVYVDYILDCRQEYTWLLR